MTRTSKKGLEKEVGPQALEQLAKQVDGLAKTEVDLHEAWLEWPLRRA